MERSGSPESDGSTQEKKKTSPMVWIGLAVIILTFGVLVGLFFIPAEALERIFQVSVIFIAVLVFVSMLLVILLLAFTVWGVNELSERIGALTDRVGEVVVQVRDTTTTVRGTAGFVGERVASPFIRVSSWASGVSTGVTTFFKGKQGKENDHE